MKKTFAFITVFVFLFTLVLSFTVNAQENDILEIEPTLNQTLTLTPNMLRQNGYHGRQIHSFYEDNFDTSVNGVLPTAIPGVTRYMNTLEVPVITQQNGHYCGPATVIQNLKYISFNAFNKTQNQVAAAIGTTGSGSSSDDMVPYMNEQIVNNDYSEYQYVKLDIDSSFTEEFYIDTIYSNVHYYDWPSFGSFHLNANVNPTNSEFTWPYSTSGGHFLSYSGIDIAPNYNDIQFTDSNYLRRFPNDPETEAYYWVSAPICLATILSFIW